MYGIVAEPYFHYKGTSRVPSEGPLFPRLSRIAQAMRGLLRPVRRGANSQQLSNLNGPKDHINMILRVQVPKHCKAARVRKGPKDKQREREREREKKKKKTYSSMNHIPQTIMIPDTEATLDALYLGTLDPLRIPESGSKA